jgi:hypothetical protein
MMRGKSANCSKSICYTSPTTLSQMIVEGNQCKLVRLYDTGTAKYKIRPTNIVMKSARKHKTLDEESNPLRRTFQL